MKIFSCCAVAILLFYLMGLFYTAKDYSYNPVKREILKNTISKTNNENIKDFYSIVIPLKNEEGNIEPLIKELELIMTLFSVDWELICIDDGSTDNTRNILLRLAKTRPHLINIFFRKNYGQSSALDAGFKAARGEFVISLDGDGQNDPADIPRLIPLMKQADLVCGIRVQRKDSWHIRFISKIANYMRNWLVKDGVHDTGCSLRIYRKACLDQIKMYEGMHRFLPALFIIGGFRVCEIPVNHRERVKGVSNYNVFNRSFNTVFDLFAVYWMQKRYLQYEITESKD
jgi:dolichol-phosphate mannosyltransferase